MLSEAIPWSEALTAVARLALAGLLGALIGVEREYRGRSAGFRTQLLVALGSALAMLVSLHFGTVYGDELGRSIQVDPARVAYGVMAGVGFLGAGAIIRYGVGIRGMTTAASLWCTAAVGLAAGFGMYFVACVTTVLVLFALYALSAIEHWIPARHYKRIMVELPAASGGDNINRIRALLTKRKVHVIDVEYVRNFKGATETITFHVALLPRAKSEDILSIAEDIPQLVRLSVK